MGLTSLQVCMDTSDWLQGGVNEEGGMDSSASSGDILTCSRPMLERRLRPQQDQALKCPRCDSTHTKFCYYNNYSLSQPRYFCKTCRRYWTKGGSLRNIPVGGGCRKNKRSSVGGVKKSSTTSSSHNATELHLSFPELQLPHFTTFLGDHNGDLGSQSFMENKFDAILGNPIRSQDFMANTDLGLGSGLGDSHGFTTFSNPHSAICSPYGISLNGSTGLMLPFEASHAEDPNVVEMKPNKQFLTIDWQDQGCSEVGKDSFGYFAGLGSWSTGMMSGYGSSATNPLV